MEDFSIREQQKPCVNKYKLPNLKNSSYKVLCVSRFHYKEKDDYIKETLFGYYQLFSNRPTDVRITRAFGERVAYVYFKNFSDAQEARLRCGNIVLHGKVAIVTAVCESFRLIFCDENNVVGQVSDNSANETSLSINANHNEHKDYELKKEEIMTDRDAYGTPKPSLKSQSYSENMNWLEYQYYLQDIPIQEYKNTSRTLYVGNLRQLVKKEELCDIFGKYGAIENVCIKKSAKANNCPYAFIEYKHLESAYHAKRQLSSLYFGKQECKISYARTLPSSKLWLGGLGPWVSASLLHKKFQTFGTIKEIEYVEGQHCAYLTYETIESANKALITMRGDSLGQQKHHLRIDFAVSHPNTLSAKTKSTSKSCFHSSRHTTHTKYKCKHHVVHSSYHDIFDPTEAKTKISEQERIIMDKCKKKQNKRQLSPDIDLSRLGEGDIKS